MLVYHADDSVTSHRVVTKLLKSLIPEIEVKSFLSIKELIESLVAATEQPFIIFSDQSMATMNGLDLLQWLKRHPKFHHLHFMMITSEAEESKMLLAKKFGAAGYILKPVRTEELAANLDRVNKLPSLSKEQLREFDVSFAEELLDLTEELFSLLNQFSDKNHTKIYQIFHTIKGNSTSLQFTVLGDFVHQIESFLNAVKTGGLYTFPKVKEILNEAIADLEAQADRIKLGEPMPPPPQRILDGMALIRANVDAGFKIVEQSPGTSQNTSPQTEDKEVLSKTVTSVRIRNESLNHLQAEFKKILQIRTRMNTFCNTLKQEFNDEHFPKELSKMIEDLGTTSASIMEFFISLRVVSAARLKNYCQQAIQQSSNLLEKPAVMEFSCDPHLEVDQAILENLESILSHLIKNSLDHGIEPTPLRVERRKCETGLIRIQLASENKEQFKLTISDDGGGIDPEKLKHALLKKNIITADIIERMSPDQSLDLIFVDGLSTKEDVSEISGRGVGMSAVKEMITQLGGSIRVQSQIAVGTTFTLTLPRFFQL